MEPTKLTTEELSALLEHAYNTGSMRNGPFKDYYQELFGHMYGESFLQGLVINSNIKLLLEKFPDGLKRYQTDAMFRSAMETLARGEDPLNMMDQLFKLVNDSTKALTDHITMCPSIHSGLNILERKERPSSIECIRSMQQYAIQGDRFDWNEQKGGYWNEYRGGFSLSFYKLNEEYFKSI